MHVHVASICFQKLHNIMQANWTFSTAFFWCPHFLWNHQGLQKKEALAQGSKSIVFETFGRQIKSPQRFLSKTAEGRKELL